MVAKITPETPKSRFFEKKMDRGMFTIAIRAKLYSCNVIFPVPFIKTVKGLLMIFNMKYKAVNKERMNGI